MNIDTQGYLIIDELLTSDELNSVFNLIGQAQFEDGQTTATDAAASVKCNLQLRAENNIHAEQVGQIVIQALSRNGLVQSAIMPKIILPPIISQYQPAMSYGLHVDSPLMGSQYTIRTDVGMTLFLSPPESYEGGELAVMTETGEKRYKLSAGGAIIYPTTKLHQVLPVTAGVRLAVVTWMQCAVRDNHKRDVLFQLSKVINSIGEKKLKSEHLVLQQVYSNLVRMWAEL